MKLAILTFLDCEEIMKSSIVHERLNRRVKIWTSSKIVPYVENIDVS